jgi:hypothetical protein
VIIATDNQIITYPKGRSFGLDINSDNLMIIFPIDKHFGLVECIRRTVEELSDRKASSLVVPTNHSFHVIRSYEVSVCADNLASC